jgi:DNA polymerase III delta prime subunit
MSQSKNLINLLKIFKNRPYHLAKYLIENEAFNPDFLKKIENSSKLNQIKEKDETSYFPNISQMEDYYNSLLDELKELSNLNNTTEIENNLNDRLDELIKLEKYEEAAALRDYMYKNDIKRKN